MLADLRYMKQLIENLCLSCDVQHTVNIRESSAKDVTHRLDVYLRCANHGLKFNVYRCDTVYKIYKCNGGGDKLEARTFDLILRYLESEIYKFKSSRILTESCPGGESINHFSTLCVQFKMEKAMKPEHSAVIAVDKKLQETKTLVALIEKQEEELKNLKALQFRINNQKELMITDSTIIQFSGTLLSIKTDSPMGKVLLEKTIDMFENVLRVNKGKLHDIEFSN